MNKAALLPLAFGLTISSIASAAEEPRKSPLEDAPAIRHRLELRDKRFELGAGMATSFAQDFHQAVMVTGRLGFHLTDWLAVAGVGGYNVTPDLKTGNAKRIINSLRDTVMDRAPTPEEAEGSMNKMAWMAGVQAELVPFTGKFSLFSKLFMNYDFYAFGGPGFVNFKADAPACTSAGPNCPVTGTKIGANFGVGMHAYINDFLAINLEVRDILVRNNPSGRDTNGDRVANDFDLSWDSNYLFGLNLMFFLPATAPVGP
jgi:outer membrane beta-barrel protein